jgi:hypothetical protein
MCGRESNPTHSRIGIQTFYPTECIVNTVNQLLGSQSSPFNRIIERLERTGKTLSDDTLGGQVGCWLV